MLSSGSGPEMGLWVIWKPHTTSSNCLGPPEAEVVEGGSLGLAASRKQNWAVPPN